MPELLAGVSTDYLDMDDYLADFGRASADLDGPMWKSERAQSFREPGNPSWEAFAAGRWAEAVELAATGRTELKAYFADLEARGYPLYRVRAVELPPTPYLQWAMHVVRTRAQAGERARVVGTDLLRPVEARHGRLPELLLLGNRVGYVVDYAGDGTARGAYRFTDHQAIRRCVALLSDLYDQSEDLDAFFHREIAPLAPPTR